VPSAVGVASERSGYARHKASPTGEALGYPGVGRLHEIQCEAPKIVKLVYNSNNYGLWYLKL